MNLKQIKISLGIVLVMSVLIFCTYLYIENTKEKLKLELSSQIDSIMQGRKILMDGQMNENVLVKQVKVPNDGYTVQYEGIKKYYTLKNGGFFFYVLENTSPNTYEVYNIVSKDIGYKVTSSSESGIEYPPIRDCYKNVFDYFINESPKYKSTFVAGSTEAIKRFATLENRYYKIDLLDKHSFGFQTSGHPCISTDYVNLFYTVSGQKYTVKPIRAGVIWDYVIYLSVEMTILGILGFIFLYKPKNN